MKEIKSTTVLNGDELPCHEQNILHTEQEKDFRLRIWYVENKRE